MQKLYNVEFDHKPNEVEVYKTGVDVVTRCEEVVKPDDMSEGGTRTVWMCDLDRYESDEYIKYQMAQNKALEKQISDTQLALCDVYEMMLG